MEDTVIEEFTDFAGRYEEKPTILPIILFLVFLFAFLTMSLWVISVVFIFNNATAGTAATIATIIVVVAVILSILRRRIAGEDAFMYYLVSFILLLIGVGIATYYVNSYYGIDNYVQAFFYLLLGVILGALFAFGVVFVILIGRLKVLQTKKIIERQRGYKG